MSFISRRVLSVCSSSVSCVLLLHFHIPMATSRAHLTALIDLRVSSHQMTALNLFPNTSTQKKPLLIYHSAFHLSASACSIEQHLSRVRSQWRSTMYSQSHFHSTAHEVLCVASGKARLCFRGDENPERVEAMLRKGDVIVVPQVWRIVC